MLADVVDVLRCPHCGAGLALRGRAVRCGEGHGFDVARHGYVSLLPGAGSRHTGDSPPMVAAREAFLAGGHYHRLAETVAGEAKRIASGQPGCVAEIGAGTAYFLAAALRRLPGHAGLAVDASKHAARRAARAHPRIGAVVCDVWRTLPVASAAAAVVLIVLAPRNPSEIIRVLAPRGGLVVVTPTRRHLRELVGPLRLVTVDERKDERLGEQFGALALAGQRTCEHPMTLTRTDVRRLVAMGPSARHADAATVDARVAALPEPFTATASFRVSVYRLARWAQAPPCPLSPP